jgi:hypothetical protein
MGSCPVPPVAADGFCHRSQVLDLRSICVEDDPGLPVQAAYTDLYSGPGCTSHLEAEDLTSPDATLLDRIHICLPAKVNEVGRWF